MNGNVNKIHLIHIKLILILILLVHFQFLIGQENWELKVDKDLMNELRVENKFENFIVYIEGNPNLDKAFFIQDWNERGRYVYNRLKENAENSQSALIKNLEAMIDSEIVNSFKSYWIINCIEVDGNYKSIERLATMNQVKSIEYPPKFKLIDGTETIIKNDGQENIEWNIQKISAPQVWTKLNSFGKDIVVGHIDTGVEYVHPALVKQYRGNLGNGQYDHNYNWYDPTGTFPNYPGDNNGHGTHTMGIILGTDGNSNQIGVAPGAKWISAKGCENDNCNFVIPALQWMLAPTDQNGNYPDPSKRPMVINNSWGSCEYNNYFRIAIYNLRAAGIPCIFTAGNTTNCNYLNPFCGSINTPATYLESFAVGNTNSSDEIDITSVWGPSVDPYNPNAIKPEVSAPGTYIRSSILEGRYGLKSGTSMAAPHAVGTIALVLSVDKTLIGDVASIENIIKYSSNGISYETNCGNEGPNNIPNDAYGYGRINAFGASEEAIVHLANQNKSINPPEFGKTLRD